MTSYPPPVQRSVSTLTKLIITLGADAFKRIKKENAKVTSFLGNIGDCPYGCKVLPNWSPGLIVTADPTQRPVFREIFDLVRRKDAILAMLAGYDAALLIGDSALQVSLHDSPYYLYDLSHDDLTLQSDECVALIAEML